VALGLELRVFILSHSTITIFVLGVFKLGSLEVFAQGWLRATILLISAS
jgi:hypothetical protein